MVQVSTDDVLHLATLSALALLPDEIDRLRTDIERILSYIEQLNELDTSGVEPTYQVTGLKSVYRTDEVDDDSVSTETLLDLAPERQGQLIKVPKVL